MYKSYFFGKKKYIRRYYNMSSIDFFLDAEFSSTATGLTAALVTSGVTTNSNIHDCEAGCDITLATAQSLFQFQSDSVDMTNTASEDILYKLSYTAPGSGIPLTDDFISNTLMTASAITPGATLNAIPNDFLRYVADELFGTPKGVDLFTNEEEVLTSIQAKSVLAFNARLVALNAYGPLTYGGVQVVDGVATGSAIADSNPSKMIFDHIMASQHTRFADISGYEIDSTSWYKMPILVGDSINFILSITSPNDHSITGGATAIANRVYQIKMTVVA